MNTYNVALWRRFAVNEFPIFEDDVESSSPLLAALYVMQVHNLRVVQQVMVSCPGVPIWRHGRLALADEKEVSS